MKSPKNNKGGGGGAELPGRLKCKLWWRQYLTDFFQGADLGPPTPNPNFEAQIFAVTATPLRDVGKISLGPPSYTNPGSAPEKCFEWSLK